VRTRRLGSRRLIQALALASAALVLLACTEGTRTVTQPDVTSPTASPTTEVPDVEQPSTLPLARRHIKHVIFLIKENRSFDTLFGRFPGADGPAERVPLHRPDGSVDLIRLRPASDRTDDVDHNFISGLLGIRGGEMDGFGVLGRGNPLAPYVWYRKEQIPAYWAYAKRYELADRFFSAVYGPTGPEQLWSMSGSSAGFTSFESETPPRVSIPRPTSGRRIRTSLRRTIPR
jgi:phospholipase C